MNILEQITANKRREVRESQERITMAELAGQPYFERTTLSLKNALATGGKPGIIAEFKRKSPSRGIINAGVTPEEVTRGYVGADATGLSVLTDTEYFGGTFQDFREAREANPETPMLRKDFMVSEYQLFEARAMGADVILLIAACLTPQEVKTLSARARELGMEVLLEVHDAQELEQTLCDTVDLVGVNNRNLKDFVTTIETSLALAEQIPSGMVKISESGLKDAQTILQLYEAGYKGFLIGETFMKTASPPAALAALREAIDKQLVG